MKEHHHQARVTWTGNLGKGTRQYTAYSRDHEIGTPGTKVMIPGSADPAFRGDPDRYNPEELFLSSLSACHMLWYLHLCSVNNITVIAYCDEAESIMNEDHDGSGRFKRVILRPEVVITQDSDQDLATTLHKKAGEMCFIANSCNFPVTHQARISRENEDKNGR